jgi:predicted DNA-binding transcriptional regulator AlpA
MPDGDRVLRIKEVACLLRFSEKTVRRMIDSVTGRVEYCHRRSG